MAAPIEIAQLYFELSNESDLDGIKELLTDSTTYSSSVTGIYLGSNSIMSMQREFHGKFASLEWKVNSVEEVKPGVILFDYEFKGELPDGRKVESSGTEYVVVHDGKIQHIEIRNR